jgi:hypothetical protein
MSETSQVEWGTRSGKHSPNMLKEIINERGRVKKIGICLVRSSSVEFQRLRRSSL